MDRKKVIKTIAATIYRDDNWKHFVSKEWEPIASQILSILCAEIKKMGLSDEEISLIRSQAYCSEGYPLNFTEFSVKDLIRKVFQATIDKVVNNLEGK